MTKMYLVKTGRWNVLPKRLHSKSILKWLALGIMSITAFHLPLQAQSNATFTIQIKNAPIEKVFDNIQQQSNYRVLYNNLLISKANKVSVNAKNATLSTVMVQTLKGQPLAYKVEGNSVIITPKESEEKEKEVISDTTTSIHGRVEASGANEVIPGATVRVKGTQIATVTDGNGNFTLQNVPKGATLSITSIGYAPQEYKFNGNNNVIIKLAATIAHLDSVAVTVSTGYQELPKERATGSFVQINNKLLNRSVSSNILDRLDGVTSGLIFNKNVDPSLPNNQSAISIRGRSTIFANPNPLIIVDNFPYDGDISTINPNDVESITVLKDAAAASIWGAFSGNGVIVITTKKGRYNSPLKVSFNANVKITDKPNLYYSPYLKSKDYIEVEKYLFDQGYYNGTLSTGYSRISPVVEILNQEKNAQISETEANNQLNKFGQQDIRDDLNKYYYRKSISQQYAINFTGGSTNDQYYFSLGYDKDLNNLIRNNNDRVTINANNTYTFFNRKIELTSNIIFTQEHRHNNNGGYSNIGVIYPYARITDDAGNALSVPSGYNEEYTDTAGNGLLLDWKNRPLDELKLADNRSNLTNYRLRFALKYKILKGLDANLLYQFNKGVTKSSNLHSPESYTSRNLINEYTQIDPTGSVVHPIPLGGILDESEGDYFSNNGRLQINYSKEWNRKHSVNAIAGAEIRDVQSTYKTSRLYGYNESLETNIPVNYVDLFPYYYQPGNTSRIPYNDYNSSAVNRFLSYFANASYSYNDRYVLSVSARKDESNIFGVSTNQKGVPLWSIGGSWEASKESFYHIDWLPYLRLRLTDGYNGNVDEDISALITSSSDIPNTFNAPTQILNNAPNSKLRWEKIHIINAGLDFALSHNAIKGSIEYYLKNGNDLIGDAPIDPNTGISTFTGNIADMKGSGLDISIQSININKKFKWMTAFLLSYNANKTTRYLLKPSSALDYMNVGLINPVVGMPLYSIYGLQWTGLDSDGNPTVMFDGKPSSGNISEYSSILYSTDFDNILYKGSAVPLAFGSMLNTFTIKQFSLSFNVIYKLRYYFRRNSVSYTSLFSGTSIGSSDYSKRWQRPGDEGNTTVPSMIYPANSSRDLIYQYSDILIDRGDHIRLQDIRFTYDFSSNQLERVHLKQLSIYIYMRNLGIIWKANNDHIDPDYIPYNGITYPNPLSIATGVNLQF